jgi:poly(3-hydroxyalkanoate) synthetase
MDSHGRSSVHAETPRPFAYPEVGVPFLWPLGCTLDVESERLDLMIRSVSFLLQAIRELFKENRLVRGEFVALGSTIRLADIRCPLTLLAGENDDITPAEQVLSTAMVVGTPPDRIVRDIAPGGHIGLFMGRRAVADNWRRIARRLLNPRGIAL